MRFLLLGSYSNELPFLKGETFRSSAVHANFDVLRVALQFPVTSACRDLAGTHACRYILDSTVDGGLEKRIAFRAIGYIAYGDRHCVTDLAVVVGTGCHSAVDNLWHFHHNKYLLCPLNRNLV